MNTSITAPARLKVPLMRTLTSRIRGPGCVVAPTTALGSDATIGGEGVLVVLTKGAGATDELGAIGSDGAPGGERSGGGAGGASGGGGGGGSGAGAGGSVGVGGSVGGWTHRWTP